LAAMEKSHGFDGAGDFFIEDDNRLRFRGEATSAPYNYMGVHITRPDIVDHMADDVFSLSPIWRDLATKRRLQGVVADVEWMHVGDPEAKAYADTRLRERP
jgi:MurNAc alpha-1-phosphate uridylyltransferase